MSSLHGFCPACKKHKHVARTIEEPTVTLTQESNALPVMSVTLGYTCDTCKSVFDIRYTGTVAKASTQLR